MLVAPLHVPSDRCDKKKKSLHLMIGYIIILKEVHLMELIML
jgi:hypothetical protein